MGDISQINRIAARQHGAFNIDQARAAGFERAAVHHRIETGVWVRLDDSVYALESAPRTWEQTLSAALLSRPRAVLTHATAACLFGLTGFGRTTPVILVPRGSNVRSDVARVFESDQFDSIAKTTAQGFLVTTMPETMLLLARELRGLELERVFDEAVITGALDLTAMSRTLDREKGRRTPGAPQLRSLTTSRRPDAVSRSSTYLERLLERILRDPRVPVRIREYEFSLDGATARVDVYVPSAALVIEADGRNWHMKWQDFETDRRRDNALAARGIQVLRFTYRMLTSEPEKCLDQILAACAHRAA